MNKTYRNLIISMLVVSLIFIWAGSIVTKEDNLKSKIGQMLIVGFRGLEVDSDSSITKAINDLNLGGVILFDYDVPSKGEIKRNITDPEQTKELIKNLKSASPSLFVAVDSEGGLINRLKDKYGFTNIPSAENMGLEDPDQTKEHALFLGNQLRELGFNVNFAPVVDVNVNPENPVIGGIQRSFSEDPEVVTAHASSFISGLNENNIISAIKHFPGHGSSEDDSHLGLVDITNTYQTEELIPYREIINSGYNDMVMTAHVMNTNIDADYPATMSPNFLQNILREELGFNGVIVSDDMQMGAITEHFGFEEAIIKSINAGCDLLIISNNGGEYSEEDYYRAVDIIFNAVMSGEIDIETINNSYNRIMELKKRYSLTN
ncbi:MAG: glycoside hydrolase family 3 protein [Candidatus Pacebacteria bacterium]|nr:glycoside hydrolase family 3 protein [Candidatus Paceibacterota bacterium]